MVSESLFCVTLELFGVRGYTWVIIYFFALSFTFTYGKHVISSVDMANPVWGSVFYTNVLSIIPMLLLGKSQWLLLYVVSSCSMLGVALPCS